MKYRTTNKAVISGFNGVIALAYCEFQDLFRYFDADAYTCGVYGWNSDIYDVNGAYAISTGYRPCGNIHVGADLIDKYNQIIKDTLRNSSASYEKKKETAKNILDNFVADAITQR